MPTPNGKNNDFSISPEYLKRMEDHWKNTKPLPLPTGFKERGSEATLKLLNTPVGDNHPTFEPNKPRR